MGSRLELRQYVIARRDPVSLLVLLSIFDKLMRFSAVKYFRYDSKWTLEFFNFTIVVLSVSLLTQ